MRRLRDHWRTISTATSWIRRAFLSSSRKLRFIFTTARRQRPKLRAESDRIRACAPARGTQTFMNKASRKVQRTYLTLLLFNTLAASLIWGINTLFLLDAGLNNTEAFAANAFL